MNTQEIDDYEIDGIDHGDYPDYCDAFVSSATWKDGKELTDAELDTLNDDHRDTVYDWILAWIF